MVGVQVSAQPDKNNDSKQDKGRAIVYRRKKGQQKNPKGKVISRSDQGEGMQASLFKWLIVGRILTKPREPYGRMLFDNNSVQHPNHRQPNQAAPCCPKRGRKSDNYINQGGYAQGQR